jgi:hypothetical protein
VKHTVVGMSKDNPHPTPVATVEREDVALMLARHFVSALGFTAAQVWTGWSKGQWLLESPPKCLYCVTPEGTSSR